MKKLSQKKLKERLEELDQLKVDKAAIAKAEAAIKKELLGHLEQAGSQSIAIGDKTMSKKVSSHLVEVDVVGVKKTEAERDLTKDLLESGKNNLLTIKPKKALLFGLHAKGDESITELLKKHGVRLVEKYSLEIK